MDRKARIITGICGILLFVLFAQFISAAIVSNVFTPTPDSTVTSSRTIDFKFATDQNYAGCWLNFGLTNGTIIGNSTIGDQATTKATTSKSVIFNRTEAIPIDSALGSSHNWSVFCGATQATASLIDSFNYQLRTSRPTATNPTNASIQNDQEVPISATTGVAIDLGGSDVCQYQIGLTNGTVFAFTNMIAVTSANISFVNASIETVINSSNAAFHNITYRCNDSTGFLSSDPVLFKVDTVNPTLSINNISVSSGSGSLNTTITDNNPSTCVIAVTDFSSTTVTLTAIAVGTGSTSYCTATMVGTDLSADGNYTIAYDHTDAASNAGTQATKAGVRTTLHPNWNVITYADTATDAVGLCNMISGCTQVSVFNNTAKTFTTFAASTPSVNNDTTISPGDGVHVFVSALTYLLGDDNLPDANEAAVNISLVTGDWNTMGLTENSNLTAILNQDNVTVVSYYNGTNYLTCSSTTLCTKGITDAGTIDLVPGRAVWVLVNDNVTLDRSGISG